MLVIGISGTELLAHEREWLAHPAVSGVILFTRNFADREQTTALIEQCRSATTRPLLVCVDQEGGPVQRFRQGFSELPRLSMLGEIESEVEALRAAEEHAWLMASEMRAIGIDISFAPVVDLGRGNRAIGERAFSADPEVVARMTESYIRGMHAAGMAATLKHFPGHGSVLEDTHFDVAVDDRPWEVLDAEDLLPFRAGVAAGAEAVMLAHVSYPAVDADPAGYSHRWIMDILRQKMGFTGVAISDDIGMAAAESAGGIAARLAAHQLAGCDLVLVCSPELVPMALDGVLPDAQYAEAAVNQLRGRSAPDWRNLLSTPRYVHARSLIVGGDHAGAPPEVV